MCLTTAFLKLFLQGETMTKNQAPLEKLVHHAFSAQPEQKRKFIDSLGYKNINSGYKWLYFCLRTGEDHRDILRTIPKAFGIDEWSFDDALQTTKNLRRQESRIAQLEEEQNQLKQEIIARRNFRPYLYVRTSATRPTGSITIYAIANLARYRYVFLPEKILENSLEKQQDQVGAIIRKHYKKLAGNCPGMGSISGYYFRNSYDSYMEFDNEGNSERKIDGQFFESHAVATIKNQTIAVSPH